MPRLALIVLLLGVPSCGPDWSGQDLRLAIARPERGDILYYVGSDDTYHYFCLEIASGQRVDDDASRQTYRIARRELQVPNSFPVTTDRNQWRRILPQSPLPTTGPFLTPATQPA